MVTDDGSAGYDRVVGTSDKGDSVDNFELPKFKWVFLLYFFSGWASLHLDKIIIRTKKVIAIVASVDFHSMHLFRHLIIVFGGLSGLEAALEADQSADELDPRNFFHHYINTCPIQGTRTIRTEVNLAKLYLLWPSCPNISAHWGTYNFCWCVAKNMDINFLNQIRFLFCWPSYVLK